MAARGHRVTLVANDVFAPLAARHGLAFASLGSAPDFERTFGNPDVWHWLRGWPVLVDRFVAPALGPTYQAIVQRHVPGDTLVVASTTALGARVARETLDVRLATAHTAPLDLRSVKRPPHLHAFFFQRLPAWALRLHFRLIDETGGSRALKRALNAFREGLALPPLRDLYAWRQSPDGVLGLFPEWYAPPAEDWPQPVHVTGFVRLDQPGGLSPEVEAFLAAGTPPLGFAPGSAVRPGKAWFRAVADACRRLGRRGVVVSRHAERSDFPEDVLCLPEAPFGPLLPRLAALIHHGGAGTTGHALAAGIPQLVSPMAFDQPDNALRVRRLGVGDVVPWWRFRGSLVATRLRALLDSPAVAANCRTFAARIAAEDSLELACDALERLGPNATVRGA